MHNLVQKLMRFDKAYYRGKPTVTDAEYDALRALLRKKDPNHPYFTRIGAPVSGTAKVQHRIAMGSQDNIHTEEEFLSWLKSVGWRKGDKLVLEDKLDGLSVEFVYENGTLVQAITRGDGIVGEDVTRNVTQCTGYPDQVPENIVSVRLECLLPKGVWERNFASKTENPRNAAAGILRRQNGKGAKMLSFYAFDLITEDVEDLPEVHKLEMLDEAGFLLPYCIDFKDAKEAWKFFKEYEERRDSLPYEIDGMVVKLDDPEKARALGSTNGCPRWSRALKFTPRGATTRLNEVVLQTGKTGKITPVGKVEPVRVGGTTIRSVTLCNWDEIERLKVCIGDTVTVVRAADVIPKITSVALEGTSRIPIAEPDVCPSCGSKTVKRGADFFCSDSDGVTCYAQRFYGIMGWIEKRNIMYLGEGVLEALYEAGLVRNIYELYLLSLDDLADVEVGNGRFGESRAKQVIEEIEKSRTVTLDDFYGSIGIPGIGRSLMRKLLPELSVKEYDELFDVSARAVSKVPGFGKERALDLTEYLSKFRKEIENLASMLTFAKESEGEKVLKGMKICFTGDAGVKRPVLMKLVQDAGGEVKSSVTKDTDILVIADVRSTSTKARAAREMGKRLMTPDEFLSLVGWEG